MKWLLFRAFRFVPDELFARVLFFIKLKYFLNLSKPRSFNEKVSYLKLKTDSPLREVVIDRLAVREYVVSKSSNIQLIELLWSGLNFTEVDYNLLPERFVVKANHGSGMVLIADKKKHSYQFVLNLIKEWSSFDYGGLTRERLYTKLPKTTVIEAFMTFEADVPPDFKFTCINGKVELIQIDLDRFKGHKRNLYYPNFERVHNATSYETGENIPKPVRFDDAILIAEELSSDFDFIRVDLFLLDDGIYFGELTNFPHNGMEPYRKWLDFKLGKKLTLK
jgi:hypothetical protein